MSQYTEIELLEAERDRWIDRCHEADTLNKELVNVLVTCWNTLKSYDDHYIIERKVNAVLDKVKSKRDETKSINQPENNL